MPVFTPEEYANPDARPTFEEAWERLPVVRRWGGYRVRWIGPLVDLGLDGWIEDMAAAAWGYIEGCGWTTEMDGAGDVLDRRGRVRRGWAAAFGRATRLLAQAGSYAGPESDADRWASWIAYSFREPAAELRRAALRRGWDR
jgi:hypothetical protein